MKECPFILATAGHVDHGKSALVKALTGTDPDRLPEEKARGITIDLGFAHLDWSGSRDGQPARYSIGIVDVPGHEDFVRNMVAGVGSIDAALLVVAADDGWMPQTEEHLQILGYLGVTHGVVALTKADLVADPAVVIPAIGARLAGSGLAGAPIVPVSSVTGWGLEALRSALARVFIGVPTPPDLGKPRLPVDRVFVLKGIGTVVTGTLTGGLLRRGQSVVVQPGGRRARIRTIQSHNRDVEVVAPGTRTALSLPDQDAARVRRGDVVTLGEWGEARGVFDVCVEKSSRLKEGSLPGAVPLNDGARVDVHFGTARVAARLVLAGNGSLAAGERRVARLRCAEPVFALVGDRFVVRDASERWTLAGGWVLDREASASGFRRQRRQDFLAERMAAGPDASAEILIRSLVTREGAVRRQGLLADARASAAEVAGAITRLVGQGNLDWVGEWLLDSRWWRRLRERAAAAIEAHHRAHPEHLGLELPQWRASLGDALPDPALFEALVVALELDGFERCGTTLRRRGHQAALPPALEASGLRLRRRLAEKPWDPPSRKDLAADAPSREALRFLVRTGEVMELGPELVLLNEAVAGARRLVREHLGRKGSATASELRQLLGSSRRVVIPLLEWLDQEGLTRRDGDLRRLR